jgi:uncharacterized repeat protein (TIGR03803 family)
MRKTNASEHWILTTATAIALAAASTGRAGYTLTTLASFNTNTNGPGAWPLAGLTLSGSTLYGTTNSGGAYGFGTVFSVPVTGGAPTVLASFNPSNNGAFVPQAGLILSGGTLYGTTTNGGTSDYGTVFSVPIAGGGPTILASFDGYSGATPYAGLTLSGGTLYGTTSQGGLGFNGNTVLGDGTVFSLPIAGGTPTILVWFNSKNRGPNAPMGGVTVSSDGTTLYGTTEWGGAYGAILGNGTILSVPITGGTPTVLASLNGSNGQSPEATMTLSGSTLYGTTVLGGANSKGTIFSIPVAGGTPTALASVNGSNGQNPYGSLILSGNTLYGTMGGGAYGDGIVFSVPTTGGAPTILTTFNGANGTFPVGGLTISGSTLYGVTEDGGANNEGTIFAVNLSKPAPIISLTVTAPTAFGSKVGTLALTSSSGNYYGVPARFTGTPTGYLGVSGFNPSTDTEIYGLEITDSVPSNLAADLADAASEINAASYSGYSVTASTTDPTGRFGTDADFFLTFSGSTLGTGSPYLGFDFTQLNGTTDTLSVGVVGVPEPASLALLALGAMTLLRRRR